MLSEHPNRLPYPPFDNIPDQINRPPCTVFHPYDFNRDCMVNLLDFARFAQAYLTVTFIDLGGY